MSGPFIVGAMAMLESEVMHSAKTQCHHKLIHTLRAVVSFVSEEKASEIQEHHTADVPPACAHIPVRHTVFIKLDGAVTVVSGKEFSISFQIWI